MQPEIPERSLNAVDWDRLLHFVGYGRLKAPWWFVGLEEGVRDQTVENSLRAHAQFSNDVMDLGEAMRLSGFAEVPTNPTWRFVASIAASLLGTPDWDAYRAHRMGRLDGETLLAEILPLPAPRSSVWPEIYKQKWQTRREYEREVRPERIRLLETLVREHKPALVVGYGKTNWDTYEQLTPGVEWVSEKVERTAVRHGRFGSTSVVLTYGPTSRPMNASAERTVVARRIGELMT